MIAWAVVEYQADPVKPQQRICAIENYRAQIDADNPGLTPNLWYEECLGNSAVVVVRALAATLQTIAQDPAVTRFAGVNDLGDSLAALTDAQWTGYRTKALSLGYTAAEWDAAFPLTRDNYTLRDVIAFMLRRKIRPRWDAATATIVFDGVTDAPPPPEYARQQIG
jgi:hypothetical protein